MQIVFKGAVLDHSGYAHSNRLYIRGLVKQGYNVKIIEQPDNYEDWFWELTPEECKVIKESIERPLEKDHVYFNRTPWSFFKPFTTAKRQVIATLWEATPLAKDWATGINRSKQVDLVIAHSLFNKKLFEDKLKKPVAYVKEGMDLDLFKGFAKREVHGTFNFLSNFQWVERKGYDILLNAFFREFREKDNVSLTIKTNSLDYNYVPSSIILGYISSFKMKYRKNLNVYVNTTVTSDRDIMTLYENANCFVLPTRGEGVCRPALEVMASNLPLIITNWSGQLDFVNYDNAYLIDYSMQPVTPQWYAGEFDPSYMEWAEPDIMHLQYLMRRVYENYSEAQQKASLAKKTVLQYDYIKTAKELGETLLNF